MRIWRNIFSLLLVLFLVTGCDKRSEIVSNLDEREANEIIVFLASKGIGASKSPSASAGPGAGQGSAKWSISVDEQVSTDAMAILNQNGLPRIKGTSLLDLFAKQGLMSSEKEEAIRYQAGLAEQIASTIRKIDGVIDADVQISFPVAEAAGLGAAAEIAPTKITAAVYIKHQGILDDPNSHLILKIKRLLAGSVNGLDLNDVTVISDKARFTDVTLNQMPQTISGSTSSGKEYVSIWSIVMSKKSAGKFQMLFFLLSFCAIVFALLAGWLIWKLYPSLKQKGGLKKLLNLAPFTAEEPVDNDKNLP
ncbi:MAG: type III secretion inner membrane ring lipoprotein SctJ [Rhabdochlamydiaceae bacterium]|nr:type III secretion inner membrane ring lipoprotein SctJ [Rhabdochlamydiaceae bacterium]